MVIATILWLADWLDSPKADDEARLPCIVDQMLANNPKSYCQQVLVERLAAAEQRHRQKSAPSTIIWPRNLLLSPSLRVGVVVMNSRLLLRYLRDDGIPARTG